MKKRSLNQRDDSPGEVIYLNFTALKNLRSVESATPDLLDSIRAIVTSLEEKDSYTHGHSLRVAEFSLLLARKLNLSENEIQQVELSALLHDIGKIGIPDAVLTKPEKLTASEFSIMRSHPQRSEKILGKIASLHSLIPAIKHHHERYDGLGYPDGLAGTEIPLLARIILIADTFDAITSTRPYRLALNKESAYLELKRCAGSQFDPNLVELFLQIMQKTDVTPLKNARILKKAA
jgi:HD-GYP domain-containing protein (c-di-GMP phosphodiesterase class II)